MVDRHRSTKPKQTSRESWTHDRSDHVAFIEKPFSHQALARKIRQLLDALC
jgi:hypothetical protein